MIPTESGWYWWRPDNVSEWAAVEVYPDDDLLLIYPPSYYSAHMGKSVGGSGEWFGPCLRLDPEITVLARDLAARPELRRVMEALRDMPGFDDGAAERLIERLRGEG